MRNIYRKIRSKIQLSPAADIQAERVKPWFEAAGDKTLRLNYNLGPNSVVFDLGGYEGQWASDIYAKYRSKIYIFEPMPNYAKNIEQRFSKNPDIKVYTYGLAEDNKTVKLSVDDDASSAEKKSANAVKVRLKQAHEFLHRKKIRKIDLMKINIEGGEYDLLDHLIATGDIDNILNLQVQFHDFVPDAEARMLAIQRQLKKTHKITYSFPFVWENWERKASR